MGDVYEPELVKLPEAVASSGLRSIAAGHYSSLCIDSDGGLWSWGRNREGQLGRPTSDTDDSALLPGLVTGFPERIMSGAASGVAAFAVDEGGSVWAWGSSRRGQLGLGEGVTSCPVPTRVPGLEGINRVACGWGHAAALTEDGQVYTWGYPQHGRLGHSFAAEALEAEEDVLARCVWRPRRLDLMAGARILNVSLGNDHTILLADDGRLFSFGDNSMGQLGRPQPHEKHSELEGWLVRDSDGGVPHVSQAVAGLAHNLAMTLDGSVMTWGWNGAQQLGLGSSCKEEVVSNPRHIYGLTNNLEARLGAGRVHSLVATDVVLTDDEDEEHRGGLHQVFAWGSGRNGRLGLGTQQSAAAPELIDYLDGCDIKDISCGHDHTLVLVRRLTQE